MCSCFFDCEVFGQLTYIVCIYTYIYIKIQCSYVYKDMQIYVCIYVYICIYICISMYIYSYISAHIYNHSDTDVHICIYLYVH